MIINNYKIEHIILLTILLLSSFGFIMMYSASSILAMNKYNNYLHFLLKQLNWLCIGAILMILTSRINYYFLKKTAYLILFISWIILIMGYFFKGPSEVSRWIIIGGRNWMTTSDFSRISLIIFTAFFIDKNKKRLKDLNLLIFHFTPYILISLSLILFQPDTSTTILISTIIFIMLFIAGTNFYYLCGLMIMGISGFFLKIINTEYALERILTWNDVQKIQSLNALGSGGFWGKGLGNSIIKKGFLPEVHTDFILPIVGEELGFIGIFILFSLFWMFFERSTYIIKEAPDLFSMFLAIGIIISIMIYFLINAAYVVGFAPTTGLPMPFVSYGGSHTIFTLISIGILINIAKKGSRMANRFYKGYSYAN